ncbi:MAG: HEAT repeat domain-containing protein [Calditrichia bacterium]
MDFNIENPDWQMILDQVAAIRDQQNYTTQNIAFLKEQFQSSDERIRAAAALAAEGCIFEQGVLSVVMGLSQYDDSDAVRYAAIRTLGTVIREGIEQGFEEASGANNYLDDAEEWEEYQTGSLTDEYVGVKHALLNLLEYDDDPVIQEPAMDALSWLGFQETIRYKVQDLFESGILGLQKASVRAMGKFPEYWMDELSRIISSETESALLLEAIRSVMNTHSSELASQLEALLNHENDDILIATINSLAGINQTVDLPQVLQAFSLHENTEVQLAAKRAIDLVSRKNFERYMQDDLGMELE